jgi:flagellar biogenesis protein FliO
MHAKYALSATKRLRVSETVSLGEKRFVAIVSVEGREFLIGGGASGLSLLAHLGSASGPADELQREFGVMKDSE